MVFSARQGHPGGDMSVSDILATLYLGVLRIDPKAPRAPDRDRLILSKGHASGALYATLAETGFLPAEPLQTYMKPLSMLNGHPNRNYVPGVEANTGPLGHGMPIAVGVALAGENRQGGLSRLRRHRRRRIAGGQQLGGRHGGRAPQARQPDPRSSTETRCSRARASPRPTTSSRSPTSFAHFAGTWSTWTATMSTALLEAFAPRADRTKPLCVIAHTVKGKGVSYMEDQVGWHHGVPTQAQLDQAMEELSQP